MMRYILDKRKEIATIGQYVCVEFAVGSAGEKKESYLIRCQSPEVSFVDQYGTGRANAFFSYLKDCFFYFYAQ